MPEVKSTLHPWAEKLLTVAGLFNFPSDYFLESHWTTKGLKITRLRLVSDPGYPEWDVSYCHGRIGDEEVNVGLPFSQIPKRGFTAFIIKHAIRDKVYAKGLGILDNISKLC